MNKIKLICATVLFTVLFFSCEKENLNILPEDGDELVDTRRGRNPLNHTWVQEDQMGRPAVNTVFVSSGSKDQFNTTIPSMQGAAFQSMFQSNLEGLSPAFNNPNDQNALGLNSAAFSGFLATDVLNVSLDGTTTFFDGVNVLTGRTLADDVITVELILIFGGENALAGSPENPGLIDDNVDANDKPFLNSFPYLAAPW